MTPDALAERALEQLEQWLDLCPLGAVLVDAGGLIVRSNAAFEALVGAAPVSLADADPALRELLAWDRVAALAPGAPPFVVEALLPQRDGARRLRATLRCTGYGPERHLLALIEDRSADDERELARLQLAALVDAAGVGVATLHESRGWLQRSVLALAPAGSVALQAIGRDIVEPQSRADYERLQQALRDGERAEVRYAVRHADIGRRWLLTRVEPGALASGERTVSVVTLDLTEQQLARERSDGLAHELAALAEATGAGVAVLRGQRVVRCNARFRELLGLSGDAALLGSAAQARAAELIESSLGALDDAPRFETELDCGDNGVGRWFSLSLQRGPGDGEATAVLLDVGAARSQRLELEAATREHALLFELPDVGIAYLSGGRIVHANAALARLAGYEPQALAGREHAVLFEDRAEYLRIETQARVALAAGDAWSGERRLRRADGSLVWVQASERTIEGGGNVVCYFGIDERHRAEQALREQVQQTRAILDALPVGVVGVGAHGVEWLNRAARRMFAGDPDDLIGRPLACVATDEPEHPFRRMQLLDELDEGQAHCFECRVRARDGRVFQVAGNAVLSGRGAAERRLTFALLDIDRRREAEAASAQTQASLRRIIEAAPLSIALHDAATLRVLQINPVAARSLGKPQSEIVGRSIDELFAPASAAQLRSDMRAALAAADGVARHEYKLPGRGGEARVWEARLLPLSTRDGAPPDQLLAVAADVTEQRAAEAARLEAAIAQRERLVREVHHRIKNNLQGVAGLLQQCAQRRPQVAAELGEAVGQVQAIAQVYGLQVGAGGPLRVAGMVEAIAGSVQRLHGRAIGFGIDGAVPDWSLPENDSIPIALSLNELLSNAVRHGGDGEIACSLGGDESELRIAIANPGALPAGFDLGRVRSGATTGLGLVRALLPRRGARLSIAERDGRVQALLVLAPPAIVRFDTAREPLRG